LCEGQRNGFAIRARHFVAWLCILAGEALRPFRVVLISPGQPSFFLYAFGSLCISVTRYVVVNMSVFVLIAMSLKYSLKLGIVISSVGS
jgi:hypothetical protein